MQVIKRCSIALFSFSIFVVVVDAESLPQRNYYLYVCAESDDVAEKIRFGPAGFEIIKSISVGAFPAETEGPHGISMSPDGRHWFLSIAHGMPFGSVHLTTPVLKSCRLFVKELKNVNSLLREFAQKSLWPVP